MSFILFTGLTPKNKFLLGVNSNFKMKKIRRLSDGTTYAEVYSDRKNKDDQ